MNGTRGRERDDDDDQGGHDYDQGKRINLELQQGPNHYDIYALPSFVPPSPHLASPSTTHQSCSLIVVNRSAGLATGLGLRLGLSCPPVGANASAHSTQLVPVKDPGFFLPREQGYDVQHAVHLGWVEEERLPELERIVLGSDVPRVQDPPQGGEVLEWLLGVGRGLEYHGILSNPELLLGRLLRPVRLLLSVLYL
ncbi:hypothetical protein JCM8208_001992 [Rhodotorula glutinis]